MVVSTETGLLFFLSVASSEDRRDLTSFQFQWPIAYLNKFINQLDHFFSYCRSRQR